MNFISSDNGFFMVLVICNNPDLDCLCMCSKD